MLNKESIKLLGLSREEAAVFEILRKFPNSTVTNIAESVKIPRTTVHFLLKKLKKRGFVEQIKIGGHYEWKMVSDIDLARRSRNLAESIRVKTGILEGIESENIGIELYRGQKKVEEAYEKILQAGKGDRVYAIQGNKSAEQALKKIKKEYFFNLHDEFRKKGIIMEGIIGEFTLDIFKEFDLEMLKSHLERLTIINVVPDRFVDFNVDIIMRENIVFLINPNEEFVVYIKNKPIVEVFRSLLALAQENSRKINLNEYINELIKTKEGEIQKQPLF